MILETLAYMITSESIFFCSNIPLCLTFHIGICSFLGGDQILSSCYSMRGLQRVEIYFDSMMYHGLYFSYDAWFGDTYTGHTLFVGDRFYEMINYTRHILSRDYLILRAYPFWEDLLILGIAILQIFDIETWPFVYDCYFRWIIELLTPWGQSSQHT